MTATVVRPAVLKSVKVVEHAVAVLYDLFQDDKTNQLNRQAVALIDELIPLIKRLYQPTFSVTITDATDASVAVSAVTTGQMAVAKAASVPGGSVAANPIITGDIMKVLGTGDTTDDGLEAALDATVTATFGEYSIAFTYTDTTEATLVAAFAETAVIPVALKRPIRVGDIIKMGGSGDTTDNALEAAKGSAVASGDRFLVTGVGSSAAVSYISPDVPASGQLFQFTSATAVRHIGQAAPNFDGLTAAAFDSYGA